MSNNLNEFSETAEKDHENEERESQDSENESDKTEKCDRENPQSLKPSASSNATKDHERNPIDAKSKSSIKNSDSYDIKWIEFNKQSVPIILQNENGPCPLISICNVLLLRNDLNLMNFNEKISSQQLIDQLGSTLFNKFVPHLGDLSEKNIEDSLASFDRLQYGLDVNVKFSDTKSFEYTRELDIFDLFHISLYHGWLIDPQENELYENFATKSYNQLVEISLNSCSPSSDTNSTYLSLLANQFLESSASQLTYYGLSELHSSLKPNELCVLFRNNHFSTLYKNPVDKRLYILVTDQGYMSHSKIIWESLDNIEGAGDFFDSNFHQTIRTNTPSVNSSRQEECRNDYLIALQLQENQYEADNQSASSSSQSNQRQQANRRPEADRRTQDRREPKRKSSCCLL